MFLSRVKQVHKPLSLTNKLMLMYSLSSIFLFIALGFFLYPTFSKLLAHANDTAGANLTIECYKTFILAFIFASLCAIFLGHIIARQGLSRLREFEATLESITVNSLDEKVCVENWPQELKPLGLKFNSMMERIQVSFIKLAQFSSDIAHELRTPLNNLRGITELLLAQPIVSDDKQKLLVKSIQECEQLKRLIDSLLFIARSENRQLKLDKSQFSVNNEILKVSEYYTAILEENGMTIHCYGDAVLSADKLLFQRAISNIIANAIQYAKSGKIEIRISELPDKIQVIIDDYGPGVEQQHLARIFDRFYRADASRHTSIGGLGLGLSITKAICELHQGSISVENKISGGARFVLVFSVS